MDIHNFKLKIVNRAGYFILVIFSFIAIGCADGNGDGNGAGDKKEYEKVLDKMSKIHSSLDLMKVDELERTYENFIVTRANHKVPNWLKNIDNPPSYSNRLVISLRFNKAVDKSTFKMPNPLPMPYKNTLHMHLIGETTNAQYKYMGWMRFHELTDGSFYFSPDMHEVAFISKKTITDMINQTQTECMSIEDFLIWGDVVKSSTGEFLDGDKDRKAGGDFFVPKVTICGYNP